jgi:hypothetical protein
MKSNIQRDLLYIFVRRFRSYSGPEEILAAVRKINEKTKILDSRETISLADL